ADRPSAETIRPYAHYWCHDRGTDVADRNSYQHDDAGHSLVLRYVCQGEHVENGAHDVDATANDYAECSFPVVTQEGDDWQGVRFAFVAYVLEDFGFFKVPPHEVGDDGQDATEEERDAPSPGNQLFLRHRGKGQEDQRSQRHA